MNAKQKDIALKIGVSTGNLSRMLNGKTPISKYFDNIELIFKEWKGGKIIELNNEIAALKKFRK